jgi:hypothetical protein
MAKDHFIRARVTAWEKNFVHDAAEMAHMSESEFVRHCILMNKLVIVPGLDDVLTELRRQGNNLNQLTRMAHQGVLDEVNMTACLEAYRKIWQALSSLQSHSR